MWVLFRAMEIKFIIDSSLTLKYCVNVHNAFSFFVATYFFISSNNQNSSSVLLNKCNYKITELLRALSLVDSCV